MKQFVTKNNNMKKEKSELQDFDLEVNFTALEDLHKQQFDLENKSLESDIEARHQTNRIAALQLAVHVTSPENAISSVSPDDVLDTAKKFLDFINGKQ